MAAQHFGQRQGRVCGARVGWRPRFKAEASATEAVATNIGAGLRRPVSRFNVAFNQDIPLPHREWLPGWGQPDPSGMVLREDDEYKVNNSLLGPRVSECTGPAVVHDGLHTVVA